jgi:hypothetical protein
MMSVLEMCTILDHSGIGTDIRESVLFPFIESAHVLALSLSIGLVVITDLRLMGVACALGGLLKSGRNSSRG